jgi:phosphonate transport system substrate-binding protein
MIRPPPITKPSPPRLAFICVALLLVGSTAPKLSAEDPSPALDRPVVRFAFSRNMFRDINENDARAAMKVYATTIGEANQIDVRSGPTYLDGTNAIAVALRLRQFDIISLTAEEFLSLEDQGLDGPFLLSMANQSVTEEYVLLTRADSPLGTVADLPGHSLIISRDLRTLLAPLWLEVLCREHGLGPASQVFSQITSATKPSQAVLPVFFGKVDACVTTRSGWEVMGELNPQVKKQLRIVAMSGPLVPGMSCFRRDLPATFKDRVLEAARGSRDKPSFKQLMALFKCDEVIRQPVSVLDDTRKLVARYHQLCDGTNAGKAALGANPPSDATKRGGK